MDLHRIFSEEAKLIVEALAVAAKKYDAMASTSKPGSFAYINHTGQAHKMRELRNRIVSEIEATERQQLIADRESR